jgi:hypothetical protein
LTNQSLCDIIKTKRKKERLKTMKEKLDTILNKGAEIIIKVGFTIAVLIIIGCGIKCVENACETTTIKEPVVEGYAIIHHCDGDEYVDFYSWSSYNGTITIHLMDGRTIISNDITLIFEE